MLWLFDLRGFVAPNFRCFVARVAFWLPAIHCFLACVALLLLTGYCFLALLLCGSSKQQSNRSQKATDFISQKATQATKQQAMTWVASWLWLFCLFACRTLIQTLELRAILWNEAYNFQTRSRLDLNFSPEKLIFSNISIFSYFLGLLSKFSRKIA